MAKPNMKKIKVHWGVLLDHIPLAVMKENEKLETIRKFYYTFIENYKFTQNILDQNRSYIIDISRRYICLIVVMILNILTWLYKGVSGDMQTYIVLHSSLVVIFGIFFIIEISDTVKKNTKAYNDFMRVYIHSLDWLIKNVPDTKEQIKMQNAKQSKSGYENTWNAVIKPTLKK